MKQLVMPVVVTLVLLKVLFSASDLTTRLIIAPFLTFAIAFGLKNLFIMINKKALAEKFFKIYTVAFLVYWFGFLILWNYQSFISGKYMNMVFSVPLILGGSYVTYKRLIKKK